MTAEIPQRTNRRGGPGWWMDGDGIWQPPTTWPENYAPVDGWVRDENNNWVPPAEVGPGVESEGHGDGLRLRTAETARPAVEPKRRSRRSAKKEKDRPQRSLQAEADIRAMLLVGGVIGFALLVLLGAIVLQSRAGAVEADAADERAEEEAAIVFAAETEESRNERRREVALLAPEVAADQLSELVVVADLEVPLFNESFWDVTEVECLDLTERVLLQRSAVPATFADNFDCVLSEGNWVDVYLGQELTRTVDVEVRSLVPLQNVHASGGYTWTPATREMFLNDTLHPAIMVVLASDSGHNPQNATPDEWRPADPASWCGYAVDWVAVKARWGLTVSEAEAEALDDMLSTCAQADSNGPHLNSMVIDSVAPPSIDRMSQ